MAKLLERFEAKGFGKPEETRRFEKGKVELVSVGGATIGKATFEPGWRWSTCVAPVAKTRSCEAAHLGCVLQGTIVTRMDDGSEIRMSAGDVFNIPPGHDAWVEGEETVVALDFQGLKDYAKEKG